MEADDFVGLKPFSAAELSCLAPPVPLYALQVFLRPFTYSKTRDEPLTLTVAQTADGWQARSYVCCSLRRMLRQEQIMRQFLALGQGGCTLSAFCAYTHNDRRFILEGCTPEIAQNPYLADGDAGAWLRDLLQQTLLCRIFNFSLKAVSAWQPESL